MTKDLPTVTIDGRTHEGGGQILRLAAGLSAITGKAVTITNIRAGRRPTGLRGSHVAAIKCLEVISASEAQGVVLGSESVVFHPACPVSPPSSSPSSTTSTSSKTTKSKKRTKSPNGFPFHKTFVNGTSTNPEALIVISPTSNGVNGSPTNLQQISIGQKTNGSTFLIFQAIYPYLLARALHPISVRIIGGTNTRSAPTVDYVKQVLLPNFAQFGLPPGRGKSRRAAASPGRRRQQRQRSRWEENTHAAAFP
ncbi:RNA 3'-terminal phosphate cyclase/enolpyruvate transferase [Aspergillus taichungensis]|uniref:RNA 3'-terminal phosphate cyclase/enolpyruvate transferase n=1 Tax=Aspergillus taichungensis TaxID=482145 RepID=A0A2J5HR81_9EURO|nr:RNA 3'-terminal phosphate cyclase/enolpyruvate transferase [Aspergillus taichungensis]